MNGTWRHLRKEGTMEVYFLLRIYILHGCTPYQRQIQNRGTHKHKECHNYMYDFLFRENLRERERERIRCLLIHLNTPIVFRLYHLLLFFGIIADMCITLCILYSFILITFMQLLHSTNVVFSMYKSS